MKRGAAVAAALVGAALVLSGCQYLFGPFGGPILPPEPGDFGSFDPGEFGSFDPEDPAFSFPPPAAVYKTGSAKITIGDSVTSLDQLLAPGALMADFGGNAIWTDKAGNYLLVYGGRTGEVVAAARQGRAEDQERDDLDPLDPRGHHRPLYACRPLNQSEPE